MSNILNTKSNPAKAAGLATAHRHGLGSTLVLALGTFAVGTDAFIVSAFLPVMAESLHVTAAMAGESVTAFALAYSVLSPVTATITSSLPRRPLLICATVLLGLANIGCALAPTFGALIAARIAAAAAASAYTPNAGAVAVTLVRPELRARALAVVVGGLTVATAIGVPLGGVVSTLMSWRAALVLVGVVSFAAAIGIAIVMPWMAGEPGIPLGERLSVLRRPGVLLILPLTILGMAACYTPYAFTIQVLESLAIGKAAVPLMLFAYGIGAVAGNITSGTATDRWSGGRVMVIAYMVMTTALGALAWLSVAASHAPPVAVAVLMALWGASSWAQTPAQQHRLIATAPSEAPIIVALNSAGIYLGIATGTAIGSIGISVGVTTMIVWGAALSSTALVYAAGTSRW